MTTPYSRLEAWGYDRFIAPAVRVLADRWVRDAQASLAAAARVLDVGCGGGQLLALLAAARDDVTLTGVDLNPGQVARAQQRLAPHSSRARVVQGSALELPFDSGTFDAVVSVASIKHWPDPAKGLSECARVLAPGGLLHVVEADRGCQFDDAVAFVAGWGIPKALQSAGLAFFRTYVAGRSVDLDDARQLAADLPLRDVEVARIPDTPGLMIRGIKVAG